MQGARSGRRLVGSVVVAAALVAGATPTAVNSAAASRPAAAGAVVPVPLRWAPCADDQQPPDLPPLECSSTAVPVDYADPRPGSIVLALYRAQLPSSTPRPAKILFVNSGGPGGEASLLTSVAAASYPAAVRRAYDVIGVDPRGVGRSAPVSCTQVDPEADDAAAALVIGGTPNLLVRTQDDRRLAAQAARTLVEGCLRTSGALLPYLSTDRTARDFDLVRARLGKPTAAFVGYSYGTLLFSRYATLFPRRVERLVLDSGIDATTWGLRFFQERALPFEARLGDFAAWAAGYDGRLHLGASAAAVLTTYDAIVADLDEQPLVLDDTLAVGAGDVQNAVTSAMYSSAAWPEAGQVLTDITTLLTGGVPASGARAAVSARLSEVIAATRASAALPVPAPDNQGAALYGVLCHEGDFPRGTRPVLTRHDRLLEQAPRIGALQVLGVLPCTLWPAAATSDAGPTQGIDDVPGATPLIVQAQRDPVTPFRMGLALSRLTGARLLSVTGGDHTHFGLGEACTDAAVGRYLVSGTLPPVGAACVGAPAPVPTSDDGPSPGSRVLQRARDTVRRSA